METVKEIESYFDRLWPLLRSITGDGVRQTHDILGELIPLRRHEIPTGFHALDWQIPKEWVVREAYVIRPDGRRILDVQMNNLHLLNYSIPFKGKINRSELDAHLYSDPTIPNAIPYLTSYYKPRWGFCLAHREREALPEGHYEVCIDTNLIDGSMTISDAILPGREKAEVLISTYTCHPSMANNELSGPLAAAFLYRRLAAIKDRRFTYRFVFLPETIGSAAYLAKFGKKLKSNVIAGYVITCVGNNAPFTYKRSRAGNTLADRAAEHVLNKRPGTRVLDFFPNRGSDERNYCSPAFNLPVGSIIRSVYGEYPEYHTSLDNKEFISFQALQGTIDAYLDVCQALEVNQTYQTLVAGEPQLGKRGLYPTLGSQRTWEQDLDAILWLLAYADGRHDLIAIAEKSGVPLTLLHQSAQKCLEKEMIRRSARRRLTELKS